MRQARLSIRRGLARWALATMVAVASIALPARTAHAQAWGMGNPFEPPVSRTDIDKMARIVKIEKDQKAQVDDLYSSFEQEYTAAADKMQKMMQEIQEEFQESKDPTVWQDMTKKMVDFMGHGEKLQKQLFDDVKLLLNDDQGSRWDRYERRYRREHSLRQAGGSGVISGDAVELVGIVEDLKLPSEQTTSVEPLLDQYESEMDRVVMARKKLQESQLKESMDSMGDFFGNMDKFEKMWSEGRDLSLQIRDANAKYSRLIAAALPEDTRPKFEKVYLEKTLPQVYKENFLSKSFDTAKGIEGLDDAKKTEITGIRDAWEREAAGINTKWADAIREYEVTMKMTDLWQQGNRPAAIKEAQKARRELDARTYDKLAALLTEEQRAALPARPSSAREAGFGG